MTRHRRPDEGDRADAGPAANAAGAVAGVRVDKWLWCTRFFRTRSLAQAAVEGGHVQLNGERVKASRHVRPGDRLLVTRGQERFELDVIGMPGRRGPAPESRLHYRETAQSEAARARQRDFEHLTAPVAGGRPDKRQRRDLLHFTRRRQGLSDEGDAS